MQQHRDDDEGSWTRRRALIERLIDDLREDVGKQDDRLQKLEVQLAVMAARMALWSFVIAAVATGAIQALFRWAVK